MYELLKLSLVSLLLAVLMRLTFSQPVDDEEIANPIAALRQLAEDAVVDCYEDERKMLKIDIEPEGWEGLLSGVQTSPNRNTKCIRHCIMRRNQLLNDAQHLDESAMLAFLAMAYLHNDNNNNNNSQNNNESGITEALLQRIISACKSRMSNNNDSCERSHLVSTCIMGQLNESRART